MFEEIPPSEGRDEEIRITEERLESVLHVFLYALGFAFFGVAIALLWSGCP
jgi:hypothetical protein